MDHIERAKIKKETATLLDDFYLHPSTSLLQFRFEPEGFPSTVARVRQSSVKRASIAGKDLYLFDDFFLQPEGEGLRHFSETTTFSRNSYGSPEAIQRGEKPAGSMNGKERWRFFSQPPAAIAEVFKLFAMLSDELDAEVMTLPWELCDETAHGSPAVIANKLEEASLESVGLGKHQDCNPAGRVSFGIPILYSQENEFYPQKFINGAEGNPWLISLMVYATAPGFLPEYRLGTVFYDENEKIALRVNCLNMRLVLFEGDLFHSIEESNIPIEVKTWRISYVFKLIVNPKNRDCSVKKAFSDLLSRISSVQCLSLGPEARG